MKNRSYFFALIFLSFSLLGCEPQEPGPAGECVLGQTLTCSCQEVVLGSKACTEDGTFGPCECDWGDAGLPSNGLAEDGGSTDGNEQPAEGACRDRDDDGYYDCIDENYPNRPQEVDCDDLHWTVQPGGIEYPDNGLDDDCDGQTDEDDSCACPAATEEIGAALGQALGVCGDFVESASYDGHARQPFAGPDYFGIQPRDEACLAVLSSGSALPVFETPTKNYNRSYSTTTGTHAVKFSSHEVGVTFECQLDDGTPEPCTSPHTLPDLVTGIHTLHVWATDASNNRDPIPLKFIWDASVTTSGAFIRPSENLAILAEDRPLEILIPNGNQVLGDVNPTVMGYGPVGRSVRLYFKQDGENVRTFYITVDDRGRWVLDDERWASGYYSVHELEDGFYEVRAYLAASGTGQEDEEEHIVNIEISSNAENKPIPVTEIETPARTGENAYSIEFTSDQEAATFECRLNTAGAAGTWSGCSSPESVTVPEEGVYTYEIRASLNGQTETIPAEVGFEHRNVEFAFLSPENGSATSEAMPALMGQGEIDAVLTYTLTSEDDAAFELTGETEVDYLGQWSILPESALAEGTYNLSVTYTGSFGPAATYEASFSIDGTAPDTSMPLAFYGAGLDVQPGLSFNGSDIDPDPNYDGSWSSVNDLATLELNLTKPSNARGFSFNFMFMSAEFPEFLCMSFNDTFYAIVEAGSINNGRRRNVSFDQDNNEITVNNAFFEPANGWSVDLATTPYGAPRSSMCGNSTSWDEQTCVTPEYCADEEARNAIGSGTGWLTTTVPLSELDEDFKLTFSVHDEGDGIYDSVVLIDNFQWEANPTSLVTEKEP